MISPIKFIDKLIVFMGGGTHLYSSSEVESPVMPEEMQRVDTYLKLFGDYGLAHLKLRKGK